MVAISDFARSQLLALLPGGPVGQGARGALRRSTSRRSRRRAAPRRPAGPSRILYVGTAGGAEGPAGAAGRPGPPGATRAWSAQLTLVGDGPGAGRRWSARARTPGRGRAGRRSPGAGPGRACASTTPRADVFCLPSFAEGVPVVLMEAMAAGLPVVTTRIAGIPELVEDGEEGLLVRPGRADDLEAALARLAADPRAARGDGTAGPGHGRQPARHRQDCRRAGATAPRVPPTPGMKRPEPRPSRALVAGCQIDRLDMAQTVARCEELIRAGGVAQHVAINAAKVVAMQDDPELRDIVGACELVSADGQSIVWASRLLGDPLPTRVAGIDLMEELLALAERARLRRVLPRRPRRRARDRRWRRMRERHPGLRIAGARDGYFSDEEGEAVADEIRAAAPGHPVRGHLLAEEGVLAEPLRPSHRRALRDGRRRVGGRDRRRDAPRPCRAAAAGPGVGVPAGPGAAPAVPALSGHQRPVCGAGRASRHPAAPPPGGEEGCVAGC